MIDVIKYIPKYKKDLSELMEQLQDYLISIDSFKNLTKVMNYSKKYANFLLRVVKNNSGIILLAKNEDKIIGCIVGIIEKLPLNETIGHKTKHKSARILELCVKEEFRKQKIGSLLMKEIERYFESEKCDQIRVEVYDPNTNAHSFYQKVGYVNESIDLVKKI